MSIRLFWWQEKRKDGKENYGDLLSKYLVKKISNKKIISIKHPLSGFHKYFFNNYLVIGSIITAASNKSIVWGSGIIKKTENIREASFLAVRGPETRKRILDLGYNCPEVYGDPAILLPKYYENNINKKYRIGIIPHYVDFQEIKGNICDGRIKVIDLLTKDVENTTNDILECDMIISSSLHGVIVPQAYNIPALWVKFSNRLSGDNIKFYDYFQSINIDFGQEISLFSKEINYDLLLELLNKNKNILLPNKDILRLRQNQLMEVCPFKK